MKGVNKGVNKIQREETLEMKVKVKKIKIIYRLQL